MPPKALVRADRFIRDEVSNIPRSRRREAKALTMCLVMFFCLLAPGNIADRLTEADAVLPKPFELQQLLSTVRALARADR